MRILLLGEYSNVHNTLSKGLKQLGHEVTVVSNGDFWKGYPRDISLVRTPGKWGGMCYMARLLQLLPRLRGYDVVQIINPMFLELKARRILPIYRYLRSHNGKMFMGAFGSDYYWAHENITRMPLRYSDFNIGATLRTDNEAMRERNDWLGTYKERLNKFIAHDCNGIIAGLYEYMACYEPVFPDKTTFIPYPIECGRTPVITPHKHLNIFIGINRERSIYKGTDIMLAAAKDIARRYPQHVRLLVAESVPFNEYTGMMKESDVILDQLYSYTPAMNALEAMKHGLIVVGGGEEENYDIINEHTLRPIVNVKPSYNSVYNGLEQLIKHPEKVMEMRRQSVEYIKKHHDYIKVARQYIDFYGMENKI